MGVGILSALLQPGEVNSAGSLSHPVRPLDRAVSQHQLSRNLGGVFQIRSHFETRPQINLRAGSFDLRGVPCLTSAVDTYGESSARPFMNGTKTKLHAWQRLLLSIPSSR